MRHLTPVLLLASGVICTPVYAESVVPNFTRGTITATTESTTKIIEAIRQVEYTTGTSYTVTGTNINIPGKPNIIEYYLPGGCTCLTACLMAIQVPNLGSGTSNHTRSA